MSSEEIDLSQAETPEFRKLVDTMILEIAPKDPELQERIKYVETTASNRDWTFYQMAYVVLQQHRLGRRAADWLKSL